jgi:hypothetical protein
VFLCEQDQSFSLLRRFGEVLTTSPHSHENLGAFVYLMSDEAKKTTHFTTQI